MNYLTLLQHFAPAVSAGGLVLSFRQLSAAWTLALAVLFGGGFMLTPVATLAQDAAAPAVASVNINTASAEALAAGLTGVGHSRAVEIVRYREAYGPFSTVDELAEVKGIGQSTLDKNRTVITLE